MLLSADGAQHLVTNKRKANIISYNLYIIHKRLAELGFTTTRIYNILTTMQIDADEKLIFS